MQKFKIKPNTDSVVLDPDTKQALKKTGELKPRNEYWLRRLLEGVVVEIKPKSTKEKT